MNSDILQDWYLKINPNGRYAAMSDAVPIILGSLESVNRCSENASATVGAPSIGKVMTHLACNTGSQPWSTILLATCQSLSLAP